jgi:hypothetical protein
MGGPSSFPQGGMGGGDDSESPMGGMGDPEGGSSMGDPSPFPQGGMAGGDDSESPMGGFGNSEGGQSMGGPSSFPQGGMGGGDDSESPMGGMGDSEGGQSMGGASSFPQEGMTGGDDFESPGGNSPMASGGQGGSSTGEADLAGAPAQNGKAPDSNAYNRCWQEKFTPCFQQVHYTKHALCEQLRSKCDEINKQLNACTSNPSSCPDLDALLAAITIPSDGAGDALGGNQSPPTTQT